MGINLSGTAAWAAGDRLENGTYVFRPAPKGVEKSASSAGNPQVVVDWRVAFGDFTGAEQRDYVTFTEAAGGRIVQLIEACGQQVPQTDFASYEDLRDWVHDMLVKQQPAVEGIVRVKPSRKDPSKEYPEIVGYRQPADLPSGASAVTGGPKVNGNGNGSGAKSEVPFRAEPVPSFLDVKAHEARSL